MTKYACAHIVTQSETSESVKLELQKQLKSVNLGRPGRGHRYRANKQLNSVKLGFSYRDNRTEQGGHD